LFERDAGLRIDHFLLSPSVVSSLKSGGVDRKPRSWEHTSDHAPVMIEIDLAEAAEGESPHRVDERRAGPSYCG
jgi:exodeoxyribonuclease III